MFVTRDTCLSEGYELPLYSIDFHSSLSSATEIITALFTANKILLHFASYFL